MDSSAASVKVLMVFLLQQAYACQSKHSRTRAPSKSPWPWSTIFPILLVRHG